MNYNSDDACSNESLGAAAAVDGDLKRLPQRHPQHNATSSLEDLDTMLNPPVDEETTISGKPFPARPSTIKYVNIAKTHENHTYRDFTNMPMDSNYVLPESIEQMTFHEKLYHLLSLNTAERRVAIDWCCHGRAFHIANADYLLQIGVLRCYFGFNSIQRLRKQLNNYGYKLLVGGSSSTECYYSEFLLLGLPYLLQFSPPSVNRRRLLPDPDNEPNFDRISMLFPLPSDRRALVTEARRQLRVRGCYISNEVFEFVVARPP